MFILVIDDDEVMRELLAALLHAEGHRVPTAAAPDAAFGTVREAELLDVVLTDLRMPGVDAPAMLRSLREAMSTSTRLIGMSGSDAAPEEMALLDAFLLKPFSVEEFLTLAQCAAAPRPSSESHGSVRRDALVLDEAIYAQMAKALPTKALRELYELTLDDVAKRSLLIRRAAAAGDSATCRSEAHAMKGGCGMVGALELRAIASDIETGSPVDTKVLSEIDAAAERLRRMLNALTL